MSGLALGQRLLAAVIGTLLFGVCRGVRKNRVRGLQSPEPTGDLAGEVEYCGAGDSDYLGPKPIWNDIGQKFVEATVLHQLESHHVIAIAPVVPIFDGGEIVAQLFKALPRKPVAAMATTSLTKVVLIGHSYVDGAEGITVGAEACKADLIDKEAADWFKKNTMNPMVLSRMDEPDCCPTTVNPTIDQQMPFLSMIFDEPDPNKPNEKVRTIKGNLLPIMIQKQSIDIGSALGEALSALVGPSGIWVHEKVLFVFSSDMSHGIKKKFALPIDKDLVQTITNGGFGPTATMVAKTKKQDQNPGSPADFVTKAPFGYSTVLAATKLAQNLKYRGSPMAITSSGAYEAKEGQSVLTNGLDPVRGYATIVWIGDTRSEEEKAGAGPPENTFAPTTTTTTTAAIHPGEQQFHETVTNAPVPVVAAPGLRGQ